MAGSEVEQPDAWSYDERQLAAAADARPPKPTDRDSSDPVIRLAPWNDGSWPRTACGDRQVWGHSIWASTTARSHRRLDGRRSEIRQLPRRSDPRCGKPASDCTGWFLFFSSSTSRSQRRRRAGEQLPGHRSLDGYSMQRLLGRRTRDQKYSPATPANRSFNRATAAAGRVRYVLSLPLPRSTQSSASASYTGRQPSRWRSSIAGLGR